MEVLEVAYRMRVLFEREITSKYYHTYKGKFGQVQVEVMDYLYEHGASQAQQLSEELNISKQHMSKIIARLEAEALIDRRPDPEDRRAYRFALSDKGRALVKAHIDESAVYSQKRMEKLNEADLARLKTAMEDIVEILEKL